MTAKQTCQCFLISIGCMDQLIEIQKLIPVKNPCFRTLSVVCQIMSYILQIIYLFISCCPFYWLDDILFHWNHFGIRLIWTLFHIFILISRNVSFGHILSFNQEDRVASCHVVYILGLKGKDNIGYQQLNDRSHFVTGKWDEIFLSTGDVNHLPPVVEG